MPKRGNEMISKRLSENVINLRSLMKNSDDLTIKYARAAGNDICFAVCEGQTDTLQTAEMIFRPLNEITGCMTADRLLGYIEGELIIASELKQLSEYDDIAAALMNGFCVIFIDGVSAALSAGVQGYEKRSVSEPLNHQNIRGSREGFVEALRTNMSLVRRRVKSTDLVFKLGKAGTTSNTEICVCYIEGRVSKKLLGEIEAKLSALKLPIISDSGFIQPFIDVDNLLFAESGATERPDEFVHKLYEGKVGIIVDGTPFAIVVPKLFSENFSMLDDYTEKPVFASLMRCLRYLAFSVSVLLPGFYLALANFHPELIPDALLLNLASSIIITPYNMLTECLIISVFYEIMREAGLRMPANVGHAVSIVGGIVIGDIVVSAGLVGAPMLLIIALSSICSYIVPDLYNSIVVMRFAFIFAGGFFGLFGITAAGFFFCIKLCSMNAYGVPFTAPVSPFSLSGMKDLFLRFGWRSLIKNDMKIQNLNGADINE